MSVPFDQVPATEVGVVAMDLDHNGKPDAVPIEFAKNAALMPSKRWA